MADIALSYRVQVGEFGFQVREIKGSEHISCAFRLELGFVLDPQTMVGIPEAFDPDDVIKETVTIIMERGNVPVRRIQGVLMECELQGSRMGHPEVTMVVEPRLGLLKHRRDVRIHRDLDVPQIVTEVCEALGVKIENRLKNSYPNRPYCVQWRETDYDYVRRLMEDEGIFFFFTDGDVMVLGDNPGAYDELPGGRVLPFHHQGGMSRNDDGVHQIGSRAQLTPGKVTLRDWNTEHPNLDMDVSKGTALPAMPEWYDYPGEYEEPTEGHRKAQLHAEAFDRKAAAVTGRSTCGRFYPGALFTVSGVPKGAESGGYVLRKVEHDWNDVEVGYENAWEADADDITYRPPRETYVPAIYNPHTGIVCTNGEDVHCDHFGRVKIHFHWDRLRPYDDDCSHWIPSLQDNTGGSSAIPRKNWEMVVHYLEGDPDRPIVIGRVYNGDDVFQEKLPYAKDRSSLTSQTSPSRDSANEIRFEDKVGAQRMLMRAPMDQNIRVGNDQEHTVGNSNAESVEGNETVSVSGNAEWKIGDFFMPGIEGNQTWEITGDLKKSVGLGENNAVGGDHTLKITGKYEQTVFSDVNYTCDNLTEQFDKNLTEKFKEKLTTEIGGVMKIDITGKLEQTAKTGKNEHNTKNRTEKITAQHRIESTEDEIQMRYDKKRDTTVEGSVEASCQKTMSFVGSKKMETWSKTASWQAKSDITLVVNDASHAGDSAEVAAGRRSMIVIRDDVIWLKAKNRILIDITQDNNQGSSTATQISKAPAAE